jgi:uncharacterized phage protein (TIGR01671 family)
MREIKFRAWFEGHMYEIAKLDFWGDPEQATCDMARMSLTEDGYTEEYEVYLHEVELMQYTGLKDKNGKEIYEGDIVREHGNDYTPIYQNGIYMAYNVDRINDPYVSTQFNVIWRNGCEVIGSIHDNPELMEERDE